MSAGTSNADIALLVLNAIRHHAMKPELRVKVAESVIAYRMAPLLRSADNKIRAAAAEALAAICYNQPSTWYIIVRLGSLPQPVSKGPNSTNTAEQFGSHQCC